MRIGELAERTGTSRRLLRYYEEQGLIASSRADNGYRQFDERYVDRVMQVRGLLDAGLPTRIIKQILPCINQTGAIYVSDATPETIATLEQERDRVTELIRFLVRNRNAITEYLDVVRGAERQAEPATAPRTVGAGRSELV
jgi:DNA-binding transcriptional MerR regulator